MAAVSKDHKANIQNKRRKRQSRPQKKLVKVKAKAKQRKLPTRLRRNVCLLQLPKSCNLQTCPLMSWCFNKQVQDNVLSLRMSKYPLGSFWAETYRRMLMQASGQKKQDCTCVCPDFLKAKMKSMDKKHVKRKGAPVVKTAKPKRRYSDKEIFYRLANPSTLNDAHAGPSGKDTKTLGAAEGVPAIPQSLAGAPQPVVG